MTRGDAGETSSMTPMAAALREAERAAQRGEVPVGAVIVAPGMGVVAAAGNRVEELHDPTAHAELLVIRDATRSLRAARLPGHDMYVTLEPCPMCAAAIGFARLRRLYFGAPDPKGGGVEHGPRIYRSSSCHHRPDVYGGLDEVRSRALLRAFFAGLREGRPRRSD